MYFSATARTARTANAPLSTKALLLAGTALMSIMLITQPVLAGGAGGGPASDTASGTGVGGAGNDGSDTSMAGAGTDGSGTNGGGGGSYGSLSGGGVGASGGNGSDESQSGGGGGGDGVALTNEDSHISSTSAGGNGGNGGNGSSLSPSHAGGGGGGGAGIVSSGTANSLTISDNIAVSGGNGGNGGSAMGMNGGDAGGGGAGIGVSGLTITLGDNSTTKGGNGGNGGDGEMYGGKGGNAGDGVTGDNLIITNNGTITGGNGGAGGVASGNVNNRGQGGDGGNGIEGSNLTITNNGTIGQGTGDKSASQSVKYGKDGKAIVFTGGTNKLTLGSSSTINGDISVTGSLEMAQDTDATLSNKIEGTGSLTKTGTGNLTLSGANTYSGGTTVSGGTLTGTTDSLQGDITNNASVAFDQSTDGSYAGNISGTGALTKTGSGNVTLSGLNTYNGGTTVSGGTLTGTTDSLQGDITNNATVAFDQSTDGSYAGNISGTGSLTKTGSGNVTLSGTNDYRGGTTVSGGTLTGTTASLKGDITNNATVAFDQSTDGSYAGNISGTGSLTKTGSGNVTLSGTNDYRGGTTVSGGTLTGTTASLQRDITNNATVAFDQATDGTYAGIMSGTGSLTKLGSGKLTLSGTNTYSGTTTVSAGTLAVNGAIASSAFTVQTGATLGGTGTVGATTIQSGGIHAPGNSIGTQTVNGNYALNAGSTLLIEVDSTTADKLNVNGTVTLGGNLRIVGLPNNDMSANNNYSHVIIDNDAADAVTGTFANIDNQLAFYDEQISYTSGTGNDVVLTLTRNQTTHNDVARTPNQSAAASVVDNMAGTDGTTVKNAILGLTTTQAAHAYEQLSGDAYVSASEINHQIIGQTSGQINGRMSALGAGQTGNGSALISASSLSPAALAGFAQAGPISSDPLAYDTDAPMLGIRTGSGAQSGAAVWVQAIGGKGRIDGDGNADNTDYKWTGVLGGYDTRLSEDTVVGVYFGYANGENRQSQRDATLENDTLMAGVYGTHDLGDDWHASAQAGWSHIAIDSTRNLAFGSVNRTATADYADHTFNTDIEIAKGFAMAQNWRMEPYGGLGVLWNHQGSFAENGAGSANITRKSDDDISGTARIGVRFAGIVDAGDGKTLIPQFRLGWDHHLGPISNTDTLALDGGSSFTVSGTDRDRDTLVGNLGFVLADDAGWSLYADYQPSVSENSHEHALGAGLRVKF